MKKLNQLTNKDLQLYPIWLYQGKSDEIAIVKPCSKFENPNREIYIARTRYTLNDGTVLYGYCSPTDDSGLDYIQPVIIHSNQHIKFWYDEKPKEEELESTCELIGKQPSEVFPIKFECLVSFEEHFVSGKIEKIKTT